MKKKYSAFYVDIFSLIRGYCSVVKNLTCEAMPSDHLHLALGSGQRKH